jgi:hypothetical protein
MSVKNVDFEYDKSSSESLDSDDSDEGNRDDE